MWQKICRWTTTVAENTSLHGVVWYARTDSKVFKAIVCSLSVVAIVALPVALVVLMVNFYHDTLVMSSIEKIKSDNATYPNITVCHPSFFDGEKMKGNRVEFIGLSRNALMLTFQTMV